MKFEQQQRLQSIANPNTQLARGTMAVADVMQNFGQWGMERYKQMRVESAKEEALAVEPSAEAPELRSKMTLTGQAYNEIVLMGHGAAIKNDYTQNLNRIAIEHQDDPVAFNNAAQAYKAEMLNQVAQEVRPAVDVDFDMAAIRKSAVIEQAFKERQVAESVNGILNAVNIIADDTAIAARNGDVEAMNHNAAAVEHMAITLDEMGRPDLAQKIRAGLDERIDKQIALGRAQAAIEAGQGDQYIRNFIENPPEDFTPEQADAYAATMVTMNNRYKSTQAEQSLKASIEMQREISNIQIAAKQGAGDPEELMARTEELFDIGAITMSQRTSIFNDILGADNARQQKAADFSLVTARLQGQEGLYIDPKIQDEYFETQFLPNVAQMGEVEGRAAIVQYIDSMKRVPTALKNQLTTYVSSDNVDLIVEASKLVDQIDQIPGVVGAVFPPEQEAFMRNVVALSANLTPGEAVQLARNNTSPNDTARIEARQQNLKEFEKAKFGGLDYRSEAEDLFNPIFGGTQVGELVADQLTKEYKGLVQNYYIAGMTLDDAKTKAEQIVSRNWSVWNGHAMKYAPDKYYSVAGSTDYIIDQLYADVNKEQVFGEEVRKSELMLFSTEKTARTAQTGQPEYMVYIVKDGSLTPITGFTWKPDMEREVKRVERANKKRLESIETEQPVNEGDMPEDWSRY